MWTGTYHTAMEGGLRVPFIIRWPGKIAAGRVTNEIAHVVDLFPTLARMAGAPVPVDRVIDGRRRKRCEHRQQFEIALIVTVDHIGFEVDDSDDPAISTWKTCGIPS